MKSLVPALILGAPALGVWATGISAQPVEVRGLTAPQMFEIAANAQGSGDTAAAEAIFKALAQDPDVEVRVEARFRHGQMLAGQGKLTEAAVLYRAILDEKPDAQRVRLELAALLARMGDLSGAGRAMRQAQAGGLPPEVAQLVSQYQGALRSLRPWGFSLEVAMAPSSNINRATSASTLDTIIAPFELSDEARAQSGVGARLGGQAYLRLPVSKSARVTVRGSALGNLYRKSAFNDVIATTEAGVETVVGRSALRLFGGHSWRWYGGDAYAGTDTVTLTWLRPLGKTAQLEGEAGIGWANYKRNDLQDGRIHDASLSYEKAFNTKTGMRLTLSGQRQTARDPGYATASGGINLLGYREWGKATLYANLGLVRLEADQRLSLFPKRRQDWLMRAGAGASFRQVKFAGFAPLIRVSYERNRSTVGLYDYRRLATDLGVTRAF